MTDRRPSKARNKPLAKKALPRSSGKTVKLLVGTKKGLFVYTSDRGRNKWKLSGRHFFGEIVNHAVLDPRDQKTVLVAARTGHLGPTVFRSADRGKTWKEAASPPCFPKAPQGQTGKTVGTVFWLTPGHPSEPGVWYAGTTPHALFRSEDGGGSWTEVAELRAYIELLAKKEGFIGETPGGAITHSIRIDPRDAKHMYVGLSTGGVFETKDQGRNWKPLNENVLADFLPEKYPEYGQDPHDLDIHPLFPDRLYQQNHCGIYRLDKPGARWTRIGKSMPKKVGDIGFPIVLHPRDPDIIWVFPMDGTDVWPRTSPGGKPAAYISNNGGTTWKRQDRGFPKENGYFTVMRQAFNADSLDPVGLYLGTSSGEVWASKNGGESWRQIASHLPYILSVEALVVR